MIFNKKKMGRRDSSKTRVAPIFDILYDSDKTGKSWLPKLLRLPAGGNIIRINPDWDFSIQDKGWGREEKKLEPPVSLLSWLIRQWYLRDVVKLFKKYSATGVHKKVGPDFPGETFRVLKDKEEKEFGEYQMRRLILAVWFWRDGIG
jgi:hypothetical protein